MAQTGKHPSPPQRRAESGQALIEYALILILVVIALTAALIATGPALGNVFSNTVYNLIGLNGTPQENLGTRGAPTSFWLTVTAVATNPPDDREFPPNPPKPPDPTNTPGPSPTPSQVVPTITPTFTFTPPPSATPTDMAHVAPFLDPIDKPEWWRVDSSVWLGGDDWRGEYYGNKDLSGSPAAILYNSAINPLFKYNIAFDWQNESPLSGWITDNFSIRWMRHVYVAGPDPLKINFSIQSDEGVRLCANKPEVTLPAPSTAKSRPCSGAGGTMIINQWSGRTFDSGLLTGEITLDPGEHWLTLEYYEATGLAGVFLNMSNFRENVLADSLASDPNALGNCQFARVTGSQPNTVAWAWEESPLGEFPPNMRCHLELRGWVDVSTLTAPEMSFWDVWDLRGGATVTLQVAEYQPYLADGTGGPDWASGASYPLHTSGTNYAWTKFTVPVPDVTSKKITYRFIIQSGAGTGIRRYYVDDIEINNTFTETFTVCTTDVNTCGYYWHMDDPGQLSDFITSGRWSITSNRTADNSPGALDMSATSDGKYVRFGPEVDGMSPTEQANGLDNRIHSVEFKGLIRFENMDANGVGGTPDFEGDEGPGQLTFFHAYDLDIGESLEVQWTRDPRDSVPDNWSTLETLVTKTNTPQSRVMDIEEIDLRAIPSWNTTPFRLRFAMKVNKSNHNRAGWYIDNVVIDRIGLQRYGTYPFCDTAEDSSAQWLMTGQWGQSTRGAFGSSRSYTDSLLGNYLTGQETAMETRRLFDFNNDSPENIAQFGGNKDCNQNPSGAATNPVLTFWHQRSLGGNHSFSVDLYRPSHDAAGAIPATTEIPWTPIWAYSYVSRTRSQLAWERVEVNIQAAIEQLTASTWATLKGNNNPYDDDFYLRIRLDTRSGAGQGDGIYIDNIDLKDYTELSHKLWHPSDTVTVPTGQPPAGAGNGEVYSDNIDAPAEWWERWYTGGEWTGIDWDARSGNVSFHDHSEQGVTYRDDQFSVLEMNRIIDLRGVSRADLPTLYFWNRYDTGDDDFIRVQIAVEDPSRTTQAYNYIRGWGSATSYASPNFSSWETVWQIGEFKRVDTWVREQVNLNNYADDPATAGTNEGRRIRVRFVLDTYDTSSGLRQGWWLDDIRFDYRSRLRVIGLPFFDGAQNTANWVREGKWGLAPDLWRGAGGGPAALGTEDWHAYYFDCIRWMTDFSGPPAGQIKTTLPNNGGNTMSCNTDNTDQFLDSIPRTKDGTDQWLFVRQADWRNNNRRFLGNTLSTINHDYGTTGRPFGAPTGSAGNTWTDDFVARWIRRVTVLAGDYTFITTSDDGVRLRYDPPGAPGDVDDWNIINNWTFHGRTVNFSTVTLAAGEYDLTLEYFESTGSAVIILQVGNNNFSFSDSPKPSASDAVPAVASVPYGNSSLIFNGLIDLNPTGSALWIPRLQYYTYYELGSSASARTEVSIDGGFSWTTANLSNNCIGGGAQCNPVISGYSTWMPANGDWQRRSHDLRAYANRFIGLRFRLATTSDVRDGWWITEIQINN